MPKKTASPLEGKPDPAASAPVGAGADAARKTRGALTPTGLRALVAEIEEINHSHRLDDLRATVKAHKGSLRFSAGTYTCRIAGITATSTMGETHAVTAWANRARRAAIDMEG